MTEKRFRMSQGYTDRFCHDWQNNQLLNFRETVELLNKLNDECEFLEIENKSLEDGATKYAELCHKLSKENEELKIQLQNTSDQRNEFHHGARENANRVGKLLKENKKLKQKIESLKMEIAELRESEKDNYNITDGLW